MRPPWDPPPIRARQGLWRALVGGGAHGPPPGASLALKLSSSLKKISKKFRGIWTSFGTDILRSKRQAKNNN